MSEQYVGQRQVHREAFLAILDGVAERANCVVTSGYSGRGMAGVTCYGFTCSPLYRELVLNEAADAGLIGARRDSLGHDDILYFPQHECGDQVFTLEFIADDADIVDEDGDSFDGNFCGDEEDGDEETKDETRVIYVGRVR